MLLWKYYLPWQVLTGHLVSILVLLDVALKGTWCIGSTYIMWSFNPCSLGCCSERSSRVDRFMLAVEFQSLFSWMLLWKIRLPRRPPCAPRGCVSILVLLDVALKGHGAQIYKYITSKFQSLFSWMLLWKAIYYCSGAHATRFQSLFSWMLLWKSNYVNLGSPDDLVSILVLLDVALKDGREPSPPAR